MAININEADIKSIEPLRDIEGDLLGCRIALKDGTTKEFSAEELDTDDRKLLKIPDCPHLVTSPVFTESGQSTVETECRVCGKIFSPSSNTPSYDSL